MAKENVKSTQKLAYTYDNNDNIIYEYAVAENGAQTVRYHYVYDEANQLIRCDDAIQQKTFVYTYNKGGNRTETKIYTYGLGHIEGLTLLETIESKYTTLWARDRLEKYNGIDITYDGAGNPTAYNGKTYHWSGKQLKQVTAADGSYTQYNYDMDGLRAQKRQYKADSSLEYLVDYVWSDGKIVAQSLSLPMVINNISSYLTIDVKYVYEAGASAPCGVMADEGEYLFVRNLQGDVLAVVDSANGETVANYSYDAWGKLSMQITPEYDNVLMEQLIKVICPLTYRGYNYDFTTELYYLQSRYYCPEWGRFLNVDDTSILLASVGNAQSANLYAYCNNNPVNRVDYTGYEETVNPNHWNAAVLSISINLLPFVLNPYTEKLLYDSFNIAVNSKDNKTYIAKIIISADLAATILYCININESLTYELLASTLDYYAFFNDGKNPRRHLLFSIDCMAKEIKDHFEGYLAAAEKKAGSMRLGT